MSLLHLPLDFEAREDVRRLAIILGKDYSLLDPKFWAAVFAFRLWMEWGRAAKEWRALDQAWERQGIGGCWENEPLAWLIHETIACKNLSLSSMMASFTSAGILQIEQRGDLSGLVLNDFWTYNKHLSPDHLTIQQMGGKGKAHARLLRETEVAAKKQTELMAAQGSLNLLFVTNGSTPEQRERAIALIMKLDAVCNLPMRPSSGFTRTEVDHAFAIICSCTLQQIDAVCRYVMNHREDPSVPREPSRILSSFNDLLNKTTL